MNNRNDYLLVQQHYQYQIFEFVQLPVGEGFPQYGSDVMQKRHLHSHREKGQSTIRRNGEWLYFVFFLHDEITFNINTGEGSLMEKGYLTLFQPIVVVECEYNLVKETLEFF